MRVCPECGAVHSIETTVCSDCGFEFPIGEGKGGRRAPPQVDGGMVEIGGINSPERLAMLRQMSFRAMRNCRLSYQELQAYGALRQYKKGWAWHRFREQEAAPNDA